LFLALLAATTPLRAAAFALAAGLSFAGCATFGQSLMQQTAALPFLVGALAALAWGRRRAAPLLLVPALLVVAVLLRPPVIAIALGLAVAAALALRRRPRAVAIGALAILLALVAATPIVAWNLEHHGSVLAGGQIVVNERISGAHALSTWSLSPDTWGARASALLVSPARGILWYAPVVLVALVSRCWLALALVAQLLIASAFFNWHGGTLSFGPRLLAETVWVGVWLLPAEGGPIRRWLTRIALVWTVAVGVLGLLRFDPRRWELRRELERNAAAVWDVADNPIGALVTRDTGDQPLRDFSPGPWVYCQPRALMFPAGS
jgi:hypothetical protein